MIILRRIKKQLFPIGFALVVGIVTGCASTNVLESPKTVFVPETTPKKKVELIWTSRTLPKGYDYLGHVTARSWSYEGAIKRLKEGGKQLHADALIDVFYEEVGFLRSMQAFAIKYK